MFVGGGDHFRVAHRSARLHDRGGAGRGDRVQTVAEREERVGCGDRSRRANRAAFITATLTASTRLICPAPIASVRSAPVKITAFDFTCAQTRHANRSAVHSSAVGCRFVTTVRDLARRPGLDAPPITRSGCLLAVLRPGTTAISTGSAPVLTVRMPVAKSVGDDAHVLLRREDRQRVLVDRRRDHRFDERRRQRRAVAASIGRLRPTIPPKADSGSASRART